MPPTLYSELRDSAARFPYIQFILGAALVFGVAAQVIAVPVALTDIAIAAVVVVAFMFCLVLFRGVSRLKDAHLTLPVRVLAWFFTIVVICTVTGVLAYVGKKAFLQPEVASVTSPTTSAKPPADPTVVAPTAPAPPPATSAERPMVEPKKTAPPRVIAKPADKKSAESTASPAGTNCREIAVMDFSKFPPSFTKSNRCD